MESEQSHSGAIDPQYVRLSGRVLSNRLESRVLEENIQAALAAGARFIEVEAFGQHGIGGRLWRAGDAPVHLRITGHTGQRTGAMGFANTRIEIMGPASDDVGWLNAGADIVIHGHAGNGVGNAMAQGRIGVAGNIGARGMTMTKHNPRFTPPELWVLGSVGDYFAEFMAGGIAVICGVDPQNPANVLGYRPLVGMVGGKVFVRGPHEGFSRADAKQVPIDSEDGQWLCRGLKRFLTDIGRGGLYDKLADLTQWQLLAARAAHEKGGPARATMADFHHQSWDKELGPGGLIGDLTALERSPIPVITTGELRRLVPVWENRKYKAPCEATCPSGIPLPERWRLIRQGRVDEAVDLALAYTPFPAAVCGYLCPNLCMQACTRGTRGMVPVDTVRLGQASIAAGLPELPPESGRQIAVIGAGPAGISVAWQLRRMGHRAVVFDRAGALGGKMNKAIPHSRIPEDVLEKELERAGRVIARVHLQQELTPADMEQLKADYDAVVVATGAQKPRMLPIPGIEKAIAALDFLAGAKAGKLRVGQAVAIIGAGNVGCDAATEAHRLGARTITLIDIQQPASFGKERQAAEDAGATFRWPVAAKAVEDGGVRLVDGELIAADTVIVSIGDAPDLSFLPSSIATERGFIAVNAVYQSSDPKVFAIGDVVRPGLLTDAIGAGRKAAQAIGAILQGQRPAIDERPTIDARRVKSAYLDARVNGFEDLGQCGSNCLSCGTCRDCGICVAICPQGAISRVAKDGGDYAYQVNPDRCIGCGFCAGACPCGVWNLVPNEPLE